MARELENHGVHSELLRIVEHDVKPGVLKDMGPADAWPRIRDKLLEVDMLVLAIPIWIGHPTRLAQRVLERLDAELPETDEQGRPLLFDKVTMMAVVGNEDEAQHAVADLSQALAEAGCTLPTQGSRYWMGEAMHTANYQDLEHTPEVTAISTRNTAHLAKLLRDRPYPAPPRQ